MKVSDESKNFDPDSDQRVLRPPNEILLGHSGRKRVAELRRARAELDDIDTALAYYRVSESLSGGASEPPDMLYVRQRELLATGADDPVTNLAALAIAKTFDPTSPYG